MTRTESGGSGQACPGPRSAAEPAAAGQRPTGSDLRAAAIGGPAAPAGFEARLATELPKPLSIGLGTALFLVGRCSAPGGSIIRLRVRAGDSEHPVMAHGVPAFGGSAAGEHWWAIVPFAPRAQAGTVPLDLCARLPDGEARVRLGMLELDPGPSRGATADEQHSHGNGRPGGPSAMPTDAGPLVAISMATHNPPLDLFRRQIESIRAQTHPNWICLISDDGSDRERRDAMREVIGGDERFRLFLGAERLGFYRNFERALEVAPPEAAYVALCDQDDRWYPDKLEQLLRQYEPGVELVYSDMRIVSRDEEVISETYWNYRSNNHTNLASLLIANTITGAASLMRREVLDYALPFPPPQGHAYHDQWLAAVALALGRVKYLDEPLYDYVQHVDAALGHANANATGVRRRRMRGPLGGVRSDLARLRIRQLDASLRTFYFDVYSWIAVMARIVELRCGARMTPRKRRAVRRVRALEASRAGIPWLAARSLRPLLGASETFGRERPLLLALGWVRSARWRARLAAPVSLLGRGPARRAIPGLGARPHRRRHARARDSSPSREQSAPDGESLVPVLVDYFTRDGSTLMMHLLGSSPQIAVDRQHPYERKYFAYLWRWSRLLDRGDWPVEQWSPRELGSITQEQDAALLGPPPWLPRPLMERAPECPPMSRRAFELVWREFSSRAIEHARDEHRQPQADVRYYAEKHLNTWQLDLERLPPLRVIAMLRDPRDTYVSLEAFAAGRSGPALGRKLGATQREYLDQIISRQQQRLRWITQLSPRDPVRVVRYEDLILDLRRVAVELQEWLGVRLRPEAVRRFGRPQRRHVTAPTPEQSVGRWRRELSREVAQIFNDELGAEMAALGFEV